MSRLRLEAKNSQHELYCGLDHAIGWFFQIFGPPDEDGEDTVILDKCQLFDSPFGQGAMINLIREFAVDNKRSQHCISRISVDQDPAVDLPK